MGRSISAATGIIVTTGTHIVATIATKDSSYEPLRGGLRVKPAMTMKGEATTPVQAGAAMTT